MTFFHLFFCVGCFFVAFFGVCVWMGVFCVSFFCMLCFFYYLCIAKFHRGGLFLIWKGLYLEGTFSAGKSVLR